MSADKAAFFSRREMPTRAFDYPCELTGCGRPVVVRVDGQELDPLHYRLRADHRIPLRIQGPARIRIESRLLYSVEDARSLRSFQLRLHTQPGGTRYLERLIARETRHRIEVSGQHQRVGRLDVAFVDVPAHVRAVQLESNAPVIVRVTAAPQQSAGEPLNDPFNSIWELREENILSEMLSVDYPVTRRRRLAIRSARDNRFVQGGIQGWNVMRQVAVQHPGHPALRSAADNLRRHFTTYVSMLPESLEGLPLTTAWFTVRPLVARSSTSCSFVGFPGDGSQSARSLARGRFVAIPSLGAVDYRLPGRSSATQLRLAIDQSDLSDAGEIFIQLDDQSPFRLLVRRDASMTSLPIRWQPSRGEWLLALDAWQRSYADAGTLDGRLAARNLPARRIDVASLEINLSPRVSRVRLITEHAVKYDSAFSDDRASDMNSSSQLT